MKIHLALAASLLPIAACSPTLTPLQRVVAECGPADFNNPGYVNCANLVVNTLQVEQLDAARKAAAWRAVGQALQQQGQAMQQPRPAPRVPTTTQCRQTPYGFNCTEW